MRWARVGGLVFLAALTGMGLRTRFGPPPVMPPAEIVVPQNGPVIEPRKNALRCLAFAQLVLAKQYRASSNHYWFKAATELPGQSWRITGDLSVYRSGSVTTYPFECVDSDESTGVNIHPRSP